MTQCRQITGITMARKYMTVDAEKISLLASVVNDWIEYGYEPIGGITIEQSKNGLVTYYQAMYGESPR